MTAAPRQRDVASNGFAFRSLHDRNRLMPLAVRSLGKQRKVSSLRQKIFFSPMSTPSPIIEDGFCVSTLEKEGNSIRSAPREDSLNRLEQIH